MNINNLKIFIVYLASCATDTCSFTQAGVYARRQFCADLEVYRPPEPLWNPRPRKAATPLAVIRGQRNGKRSRFEKKLNY